MPEAPPSAPPALLGLGVCTLDCVQPVAEFPSGDEVIHSRGARLSGGGPVATAMVAAARLGQPAAMVDRIGDDWRGDQVWREFEQAGVDTRWLTREAGATTAFASVLAREGDGSRAIVFASGSVAEFDAAELAAIPFEQAAVLHLNGRHWPACVDAARRTRRAGGKVSFDGGAHRFREEIRELLPEVDIAIVARHFAEQLAGESEPPIERQLDALLACGVELTAVTDGERGSWFATRDGERFHQPAFIIDEVVDTTGCGDAFHGAFLAGWLDPSCDLHTAARRASAAAALNAIALGGRGHLADRAELDAFLAERPDEAHARPLTPLPA